MKRNLMGVALATLVLGSCASIVSKSKYPVRIDSSPQKATVVITDRSAKEIYNGTTPINVTLKSGAGFFKKAMYSITYTKPGYLSKTVELRAGLNGWYFGNLVFGGLIGLLIVDPATGAMYKLHTQSLNETLAKDESTAKTTNSLKVYDINEIPERWKKDLVELKETK